MAKPSSPKLTSIHKDPLKHRKSLLARLPKPAKALRDNAKTRLLGLLEQGLSDADDTLFELAKNAQNQNEQDEFFTAMRVMRSERQHIRERFIDELEQGFASLSQPPEDEFDSSGYSKLRAEDLEIVTHDALDELVAKEALTARANANFKNLLSEVAQRLDSIVLADVDSMSLPFSPAALCDYFVRAIKTAEMAVKPTLVLLKLFETSVLNQLGTFYQEMNALLIERGVLPRLSSKQNISTNTHKAADNKTHEPMGGLHLPVEEFDLPPNNGFDTSQSADFANRGTTRQNVGFAQSHTTPVANGLSQVSSCRSLGTGSSGELSHHNLSELLATLSYQSATSEDFSRQDFHLQYLQNLLKAEQNNNVALNVSGAENQLVQAIDQLFDLIGDNRQFSSHAKTLVQGLQIPLARLALTDPDIFSSPEHSARRLLNTFCDRALQFGESTPKELENDPLYHQMCAVIATLHQEPQLNAQVMQNHLEEFEAYSKAHDSRVRCFEQRVLSAEQGQHKSSKAQDLVLQTVREITQGMCLPSAVDSLIKQAWHQVMLVNGLKFGFESKPWDRCVEILIDLVTSTQPFVHAAERTHAEKALPEIVVNIEKALDDISYDLFKKEILIQNLQQCVQTILQEADTAEPSRTDALKEKTEIKKTKVIAKTDLPPEEPDSLKDINPAFVAQAGKLGRGSWFDLTDGGGKVIRCRLAAIIGANEQFIFVNRNGNKVGSFSIDEVAHFLSTQQLSQLDSNQIFDKALEQVVAGLKQKPQKIL